MFHNNTTRILCFCIDIYFTIVRNSEYNIIKKAIKKGLNIPGQKQYNQNKYIESSVYKIIQDT